MTLAPLDYLLQVALIALGVAYIITGSKVGHWFRVFWVLITGYIPGVRALTPLGYCPPCAATWIGLGTALLTNASWWVSVQCAIVSCGLTAVAQGVAGLAAEDEEDHRALWKSIRETIRGDSGE